jgi:Rrf2 family protein
LIDIALYSENGEPVAVSSISNRQNISMKYLEQIMVALRQSHLIRSVKGFKGGYVISRPANEITFQEIFDALDITILSDVEFYNVDHQTGLRKVLQEQLWNQMTSYLRQFSNQITLADMVEEYRKVRNDEREIMYYI